MAREGEGSSGTGPADIPTLVKAGGGAVREGGADTQIISF